MVSLHSNRTVAKAVLVLSRLGDICRPELFWVILLCSFNHTVVTGDWISYFTDEEISTQNLYALSKNEGLGSGRLEGSTASLQNHWPRTSKVHRSDCPLHMHSLV